MSVFKLILIKYSTHRFDIGCWLLPYAWGLHCVVWSGARFMNTKFAAWSSALLRDFASVG
jgi:hypothetical protein